MSELNCKLLVDSNSNHLQQLYCGFYLLKTQQKIALSQEIDQNSDYFEQNKQCVNSVHVGDLKVLLNHSLKLYYDMGDSQDIREEGLFWCDFYFKRSFSPQVHEKISPKIQPLDLNYMVKEDVLSWLGIQRSWSLSSGKERVKNLIREFDVFNAISYLPRLKELQSDIDESLPFNALFMCRLWEPDKDVHWQLTKEQQEDRININHVRVECIRKLKKELGKEFTGGITHTDYALKNFRDVVVDNCSITSKRNYLAQLKKYSVCISTTGLSNSIGWKFGEYVALSKAIVSERLHAQTAGGIQKGINYLQFSTADECVEQVLKLRSDKVMMNEMMQANRHYYLNHLSPEKLVMSSLQKALNLRKGL